MRVKDGGVLSVDRERVRVVMRSMLTLFELALSEEIKGNAQAAAAHMAVYERLFGAKASFASSLLIITDLLLRLDEATPVVHEDASEQALGISEADMALVEAFVRRMQTAELL